MSRRRSSRDNPPPTLPGGVADFGQTAPARPPSETVRCVLCRAHFVDDPDGRRAHVVVFGHQPRVKDRAEEGGAP